MAALRFDAKMSLVCEQDLNMVGKSMVYCMKSFEQSNLLFAGLFGAVAIIYFTMNRFEVISLIDDIVADEVCCLKYIDNSIYFICPTVPEIIRVSFPKLSMNNRRKSVVGGFDVGFI